MLYAYEILHANGWENTIAATDDEAIKNGGTIVVRLELNRDVIGDWFPHLSHEALMEAYPQHAAEIAALLDDR